MSTMDLALQEAKNRGEFYIEPVYQSIWDQITGVNPIFEVTWMNPDCSDVDAPSVYDVCFFAVDSATCGSEGVQLSASHCVHIKVIPAPPALVYGCDDETAMNFSPEATTPCVVLNIQNGCCEYVETNKPPYWVFGEEFPEQVTYADQTEFEICMYDEYDPQTGLAWANEYGWKRWNTVDGVELDFEVTDHNNGDNINIDITLNLFCDTCDVDSSVSYWDLPAQLEYFFINIGGDTIPNDVIATKHIHYLPTSSEIEQCNNPFASVTGTQQLQTAIWTAQAFDNSDSNAATDPPLVDITTTDLLTYKSTIRVPPQIIYNGPNPSDGYDLGQFAWDCEITFDINAHDCNDGETVSIFVLEDPGLPNGATVSEIVYGDTTASGTRTFFWQPTWENRGKTYKVCFIARDNSDACELNGWYSREEICMEFEVTGPAHAGTWSYEDDEFDNFKTVETSVGCQQTRALSFDNNEADMGWCVKPLAPTYQIIKDVQADNGKNNGWVDIDNHSSITVTYQCEDGGALCDGCLGASEQQQTSSSCHIQVDHNPVHGDQGSIVKVCFSAVDRHDIFDPVASDCYTFYTNQCRYCVNEGQSLTDVADKFGTEWIRLWNLNTDKGIESPSQILKSDDSDHWQRNNWVEAEKYDLYIGPVYEAQKGDTLQKIASRFHTTVGSILDNNPDFGLGEHDLSEGRDLCIITCSDKDQAQSGTYSWGY